MIYSSYKQRDPTLNGERFFGRMKRKQIVKMAKGKVILKGIGASPGRVRGEVKIIKFQEELEALASGKIIVTSFINPDFVLAIKMNPKVSGVITDRGGATCHAAIVTRELQIPYVAGTIWATKKLKDNMAVTLDGGKGIVYEREELK